MNDLTNHGVPRAFQLLWRRRPRVAAASWCKRRYGREREWRSRVGLTECGSGTSVDSSTGRHGRRISTSDLTGCWLYDGELLSQPPADAEGRFVIRKVLKK